MLLISASKRCNWISIRDSIFSADLLRCVIDASSSSRVFMLGAGAPGGVRLPYPNRVAAELRAMVVFFI